MVVCQEVCQVVCLVGCLGALELEDPLPLVEALDQQLRKWTNPLFLLMVLVPVFGNEKMYNWYFSLV